MSEPAWSPVPIPTGTTGQVNSAPADVTDSIGRFGGYTLRNTTVAAIQVDFYDNTSAATGPLIATVDLQAKGSVGANQTVPYSGEGVRYVKGVYMVASATGVQGSVFLG